MYELLLTTLDKEAIQKLKEKNNHFASYCEKKVLKTASSSSQNAAETSVEPQACQPPQQQGSQSVQDLETLPASTGGGVASDSAPRPAGTTMTASEPAVANLQLSQAQADTSNNGSQAGLNFLRSV